MRNIRELGFSEAPLLTKLYQDCFDKPPSLESLVSLLKKPSIKCFIIEEGAFLITHLLENEAEIIDIGTKPEARRQGLAHALLNHLKAKTNRIFLEVNENNIPALRLYQKESFTPVSERKNYYGNNQNALCLVWEK